MSEVLYNDLYRIDTERANWIDYNNGTYFITICCKGMAHFFGHIADGAMHHSSIGTYAVGCIRDIPSHFPECKVINFVVMPNHVHILLKLDGVEQQSSVRSGIDEFMQGVSLQRGRCSLIVSQMKGAITRYAHAEGLVFGWQSRFHDRFVRNHDELTRISNYIDNNPATWINDCFHNDDK
ncbi:MAG: transposase [Muribaculaceae bacterium]|nr:transposase [Muribaculaceae bacterium]